MLFYQLALSKKRLNCDFDEPVGQNKILRGQTHSCLLVAEAAPVSTKFMAFTEVVYQQCKKGHYMSFLYMNTVEKIIR